MKFFQRFFNKKIKKYSPTTTLAFEGSDSKFNFDPDIKDIINNINNTKDIKHNDLNKLINFYFNIKTIENCLYKLNINMIQGMSFKINNVHTIMDENNDVNDIILTLRELTYNINFSINISVKDFHETLIPIVSKKLTVKKRSN